MTDAVHSAHSMRDIAIRPGHSHAMTAATNPTDLSGLFLLRRDIVLLNHGSFGDCPRPVFEEYQRWQHGIRASPRRLRASLAGEHGCSDVTSS